MSIPLRFTSVFHFQIIVIENPHPKALPLIEATLEKKFPHTTVLFIGSNDYSLCGRTVQLD